MMSVPQGEGGGRAKLIFNWHGEGGGGSKTDILTQGGGGGQQQTKMSILAIKKTTKKQQQKSTMSVNHPTPSSQDFITYEW